jgi:hypothetical protein
MKPINDDPFNRLDHLLMLLDRLRASNGVAPLRDGHPERASMLAPSKLTFYSPYTGHRLIAYIGTKKWHEFSLSRMTP